MNQQHFRPQDQKILGVIEKLRGIGGEAYGEVGHRNPVRSDTAPLLTALTYLHRPKVMLELGTAYGFSGLHLLLGYPEGFLYTVEFDEKVAEVAQASFDAAGVSAKVLAGDAADHLNIWSQSVDLLFVDHNKAHYLPHFKLIEPWLNEGALIVADNVNDRRAECADFVEYILNKYPTAQVLPTECGLLLATV